MKNLGWGLYFTVAFGICAGAFEKVFAQDIPSESAKSPLHAFSLRMITKADDGILIQVRDPVSLKPMADSWFFCNKKSEGQFARTFATTQDNFETSFSNYFGSWYLEGAALESYANCQNWIASMADQLSSNDLLLTLDMNGTSPVFRTAILATGSPETATEELGLEGPKQDSLFDQAVADLKSSYRTLNPSHRNHLLYQGHKSKYVYVYLHGLFEDDSQLAIESYRSFHAGHNVLVGILPGHEKNPAKTLKLYSPSEWIDYSRKLVRLGRTLGDKVIIVGHSTSGMLGFLLAAEHEVDGAILIQPAFGLSKGSMIASTFIGDLLTPLARLADRRVKDMSPEGGRMVEDLLRTKMACLYDTQPDCGQVYKISVPMFIFIDPKDSIVSTAATRRMIRQLNSKLIEVKEQHKGHTEIPDLTGILQIPNEQ